MDFRVACFATILAMACLASAYVDIPDDLKHGKMRKYAACRELFDQTELPYAVVSEDAGPYKKVCNCSFRENPPQAGLRITCYYANEVVLPIRLDFYRTYITQLSYFIVRYRIRGSADEWQEQRVEAGGTPQATIDLDVGSGDPNIYEIEIYAVLNDNSRRLLNTDEISGSTGRSVRPSSSEYPVREEVEYNQRTQSFRMDFDRITDSSIELIFSTESPDTFKLEYILNGQRLPVNLDSHGRASLRNLEADRGYVFIVSYFRDNEWTEMRRKTVRTMASGTNTIGTYEPTFHDEGRDISLECPVPQDVGLQSVTWYRGADANTGVLLATYDGLTGETTYPEDRDPKIEVVGYGIVLKIKGATREDAGNYKCRYNIFGTSPFGQFVTLYITWETLPGVVAYYIQYRPYGTTGQWQTITLPDADSPSTVVDGLEPVTQYLFKVYDFTGGTRRDLLDTIVKTTGSVPGEPVGDACDSYYCGRGTCDPNPVPRCVCERGFTGERCDAAVNFCDSNPCQNGGVCNPHLTGYVCQCQSGYSGLNCERERTACNPNPCQNNGVCVSQSNGGYNCRCRRGYRGPRCQQSNNPCDPDPCDAGRCSVLGRNYHCDCNRGYVGRNCDEVDTAPSILMNCPIQEDVYGRPEMVGWFRLQDGRKEQIYTFDVINQRGSEASVRQYRGRLSSPSTGTLIIRDATPSDAGTYQCIVSYNRIRITPSAMRLLRAPHDDTRVTVTWLPSRLYVDHYNVKHRDVTGDERFVITQIPRDSRRYTFTGLKPGGLYEMTIIPFTRDGDENPPVDFTVIPSDTPTTTTTATTTTTIPPGRGDGEPEKVFETIDVVVYGPPRPVEIGGIAYLHCIYPTIDGYKPVISWKKIDGERSTFLYNKQMPPTDSTGKFTMTNERQFRVKNFQQSDAGTYECNVQFDTGRADKVGSGSVQVTAAEMVDISPPTNLIIDVTGPNTAVLTWQSSRGATGYLIRFYPTTGRFGEYDRRDVTVNRIILDELVEGNEYNVEVRATDGVRYSDPLTGIFDQVVERIPPPTNFLVNILSKTQAKISWQQPRYDGIIGFKVQYWDVSRPAAGNLVERTTTLNEMVLTDLIDGTEYQVWIQAMKDDLLSPQLSGYFMKTTPVAPNAPVLLRFKNHKSNRLTVYWDAPLGWKNSDKFRVTVKSLDEEQPFSRRYPDSAPKMLTVSGLDEGVTYLFSVQTVRDGVPSSPVYGSTQTTGLITLTAPYPDILKLECKTTIKTNIYRVRWYKVDTRNREQLILTKIETSRRNASIPNRDNEQFFGRVSAPTMTTLSIDDVRYPTDFGKYKCVASAPGKTGSHVVELVAKYPQNIAPPFRFEFDFIDDSTVKVTWMHPYPEDITSYSVRYWPTIRRYGPEKSLETSNREATLTDLIEGTEYQVVIKSRINDRISDDSLVGQFINFADHVRNVKIVRVPGTDELSISWQNPPGIDGTLFAIRDSEDEPWNDQPPMSPDRMSRRIRYPMNIGDTVYFKISTLKNNLPTPVVVQYTETDVTNVDESKPGTDVVEPGEGSEGEDRTASLAKPSPVSNLRLEAEGTDVITAVWNPTPDVYFDFYRVNITNVDTKEYEIFNITRSYIRVNQLKPNHVYEVHISTVRNNVFSYPVTDTVTLGTPGEGTGDRLVPQPTNLRFTNVMRSRFTVSWDSPRSDITDFEVRYRPVGTTSEWFSTTTRGYTSTTLRSLRTGTTYDVQVSSVLETRERSSPVTGRQKTRNYSERRASLRRPSARVVGKANDSFTLRWERGQTTSHIIVTPLGGAGSKQEFDIPIGQTSHVVGNLEPGKRYRAQIYKTSGGRKGPQTVLYVTTNPNQPSNLQPATIGSDSIVLSWTEPVSTLITGYGVIYYPTATNGMKDVDVTTNRVEIAGLEPDTEYTIQVKTKQGNEQSAPTEITLTTKPKTIDAPGNADASITGNDLFVRWTPVRDARSYEVTYYPEGDEGVAVKETIDSPTTFVRLTDVLPGHYVVKVSAVKEDQLSPTIDMTATMPVPPPRNLRISDIRNDGLTASWQAPLSIDYTVNYDVIALPTAVHTPLELPSEKRTRDTSYTFERLAPNTEYKVQVIARYGEFKSEPLTAIVTTGSVERPENVDSHVSSGVITVRWTPVENVDQYEVTYFPVDDDSSPVTVRVPSDATNYNFTSPGPGEYEIRIVAINNGNRGPHAGIRQRTGVEAPSNIQINDITENSVVVEWTPPRTRALYDFEVTLSPTDGETDEHTVQTTRENWMLFSGLEPGTRYFVKVKTVFGDESSEPITALVSTNVPIPRKIEIPEIGPGNAPIEVFWEEVPGAETYTVTYYPTGETPQTVTVSGERNSVTLANLEPETEYQVEVSAVINGISGSPIRLTINTMPVEAPRTIETQPSNEVVRVQWTPVENVDNYEVTYYPVGDVTNAVTRVVSTTYYDITDLEPGQYEITVTAVKSDHRSPTTTVRQSIGVRPPANIDFADTTENEFVVVWSPSPTPEVTSYEVRATIPQDLTQEPIVHETEDTFARFEDLSPSTTYLVEIIAKTPDQQSKPLVATVTTAIPWPKHVRETLPEEEGSLEIIWEAVPNVDSYEINYYPVGGTPELIIVDGDQTSTMVHGLLPGTDYIIEVTAILNDHASNPTRIEVTTPLAKPSTPEAEPISEGGKQSPDSVRITWEQDDTGVVYEVKYYSVVRIGDEIISGQPEVLQVPGRDGGVTITDLLPATEYIIEIKAIDGTKTSRPGKVIVTTPLDQPEDVVAREKGEQEATITWQHPVGEVTEYIIELIPNDNSGTITIPVSSGQNAVTATGLKPGTDYEVRVIAVNNDRSVQSQSTITHVTTRPSDVRPVNVRLEPGSDGSYTIVWDAPAKPVQSYRVHWVTTDESAEEHSVEIPGDQTSVTIPGLVPDTDYEIVIQAIPSGPDAETTHNSIIRRIKTDVPGLPDEIDTPEVTDNTLTIRWEAPEQDTYLTGYRVEVFPEGSETPVRATDVPRTTNTVTFSNLKPSTSYVVKITPHINLKPGTSGTHTVVTHEIENVPSPDYLLVPETTSEDIVIQWEPPHNYEYITKYNIVVEDEDGNVVVEEDLPGDTTTYTLTGLRPGATYNIYIRSYINDRPSEAVEEIVSTLPAQTARVTLSNVLPNQFEISWIPAAGEVVTYLVNVEPVGDTTAEALFFETERPSILIPGLESETTYTVQVITVGPGHLESLPTTVNVTTGSVQEETVPTRALLPEGTVSVRPGQEEIVLRWEQVPGQPVQSYQIIYKIHGTDETKIITVPSGVGQFILSSLEPREEYDIWIRALLDTGENIPVRVIDQQTVTILAPENYTPLTEEPVAAPEDGKISVIWENLGPDVTHYGVRYFRPNTEVENQVVVPGSYSGTTLSGLTPGEEYVINVIGIKNGLPVIVSNVNIGTSDVVPDETATSGTTPNGQITIQWEPELDEDDYDRVIGYKIIYERKCCLGGPEIEWVPGKDSDSATIGMLEPDTEYVFKVEATTVEGENFPVSTVHIVDVPTYPETRVSPRLNAPDIDGLDGRGFTVTVYWTPAEEDETTRVTHYTVTYTPLDNEYVTTLRVIVPSTETSHTMTGLAQNTLYNIEVRSANLPLRIVSDAASVTHLTPIEDEPVEPPVEPIPTDTDTVVHSTTSRPLTPLRTRPRLSPDATTTTGIPEPFRNTGRTSAEPIPETTTSTAGSIGRTSTEQTPEPTTPTARRTIGTPVRTEPTTPTARRTVETPRRTKPTAAPTTTTARRTVETTTSIARTSTELTPEPTPRRSFPQIFTTRRTAVTHTPASTPPRRPTAETLPTEDDSTATTKFPGKITISWEPFFEEGEDGNYRVIITHPDRPDDVKEVLLPSDVETVTVSSLEPFTRYTVHVEAVTEDENVFLIPVTIGEDHLPTTLHPYRWLFKPSITMMEPYGEESTIVHWTNPKTQPRKVTHYVLNFKPKYSTDSSRDVRVELPADTEKTSHVITGLIPNQEYVVTLQLANQLTKTRSATERQDFITGEVTVVETTRRPLLPFPTGFTRPSTAGGRRTTTTAAVTRRRTITTTTAAGRRRTTTTTAANRRRTTAATTPAEKSTFATQPTTTTSRPSIVLQSTTTSRGPELVQTTTTSEPQGSDVRDSTTISTTASTIADEDTAGVDALPTFDGRVIINWTPAETPVDHYILYWRPRDGSSPGENITIPGDTSWVGIPEPTDRPGYIITIYTVRDGDSQPIYDIQLGKSPDTGGYHLTYGPADVDRRPTFTETTTHEVFVPGTRTEVTLPDTEYTLQPGDEGDTVSTTTDREYVHWLKPIELPERQYGGPRSVTLRWNPETIGTTTRVSRFRVELVPINDPTAQTIYAYVPTNKPTNIRGLRPGVSYRLYARYIQNDGDHRKGDLAADFVIPAFSRFGRPIQPERRFGVNEVWMKELRSGELLLQWDAYPGATGYTIEYQEGPDGVLHRSEHGINDRLIVLPRLTPGGMYTIHIYANIRETPTQIYTVTVRRKITAPLPPSHVEWYNVLADSVDITWVPTQTQITGYRVTYRLGTEESEPDFVINLPANTTTYKLTGFVPGETYTVTIQSIRGEQLSRPLSFVLTIPILRVTRIYFQQTAPEEILIRWPLLTGYATGYLVRVKQVSPVGEDVVPETRLPPDQSEFTITGIKPSVRYEFSIRTLIEDKLSEPVILQLWTLRAQSEISRVEQTGTWTVTWSGDPYEVDRWRIEVRQPGRSTPIFVDDNVSPFNTNYQLTGLTPGVEYIVYIYGVKNDVSSTPILITIPANPSTVIQQNQITRTQKTQVTGIQLIQRFIIKRKLNEIEIELIPVDVVDNYVVEYKKSSDSVYTTRHVTIYRGDSSDSAVIENLEAGTAYNISITATRGDDASEMNVNVGTPARTTLVQPLAPLLNLRREPDPNPGATGFYIKWDRPFVAVTHYTVTYDYTETDGSVTKTVTEPSIYVPNVSQGYSAVYTISYTAEDGRTSPKSVMTLSYNYGTTTTSRPNTLGVEDYYYNVEDEEEP